MSDIIKISRKKVLEGIKDMEDCTPDGLDSIFGSRQVLFYTLKGEITNIAPILEEYYMFMSTGSKMYDLACEGKLEEAHWERLKEHMEKDSHHCKIEIINDEENKASHLTSEDCNAIEENECDYYRIKAEILEENENEK